MVATQGMILLPFALNALGIGGRLEGTGFNTLFAVIAFVGYWAIVARAALHHGQRRVFRVATLLIGLRLIGLYLELFENLLGTSFVFITGGALTLWAIRFWHKTIKTCLKMRKGGDPMKLKWGWNRTLFLPVVAVALLMVQAEWNASIGTVYRIQVSGYDPRDLVYGHYLQIQHELGSLGVSHRTLETTWFVSMWRKENSQRVMDSPRAWRTSPVRPAYLRRTSWVQSATWFRKRTLGNWKPPCKTRKCRRLWI